MDPRGDENLHAADEISTVIIVARGGDDGEVRSTRFLGTHHAIEGVAGLHG
jgi:hypothetical protein